MLGRGSIDDHFDREFEGTKRAVKSMFIGIGLGFAAGVAGGIYLGQSFNDYFEVLKQAPPAIRYAVDAGSAFACGSVGAGIGGIIPQLRLMYRLFKKM